MSKLKLYLEQNDIPVAVFAARINSKPQTVYRYLSGERKPSRENALVIERVTDGAVTLSSFFDDQDAPNHPGSDAA